MNLFGGHSWIKTSRLTCFALLWVTVDCAMAWSSMLAPPLGMPGDAMDNWKAASYPLVMIGCWIVCGFWTQRWKAVVPIIALCLALAIASLSYIDPDTWLMPERPGELWRLITIFTALSFLPALAATPRHYVNARRLLLFGFAIGVLGAFQDFICGPQPPFLQGSVCGGMAGEQYVRYVLTALVLAVLGLYAINQTADWLRDKFS